MSENKRMRIIVLVGLTAGLTPILNSGSSGAGGCVCNQEVSPLFSGAMLGVTPVVSADPRRATCG